MTIPSWTTIVAFSLFTGLPGAYLLWVSFRKHKGNERWTGVVLGGALVGYWLYCLVHDLKNGTNF
jgi:hypothetical protein